MVNSNQSRIEAMLERTQQHYEAKDAAAVKADRGAEISGKRVVGRPFARGVSGNPGGRPKGLVDYVKSKTNDLRELIDFLYQIHQGQEIDGHKPTFKERMEATSALLDRGAGKPTQQLQHTGDDRAKELLALRQESLRMQREAVAKQEPARDSAPAENVSPIRAMRQRQV